MCACINDIILYAYRLRQGKKHEWEKSLFLESYFSKQTPLSHSFEGYHRIVQGVYGNAYATFMPVLI